MRKVYVIFETIEYERTSVHEPIHSTLEKAIKEARSIILSIEKNQSYFANKFREIKSNTWKGGYGDETTVYIKEMEVI